MEDERRIVELQGLALTGFEVDVDAGVENDNTPTPRRRARSADWRR